MKLTLDLSLAEGYKNSSQIARRLTESWFLNNMFCPRCGNMQIEHFDNNRPVADFYCSVCNNEYELKSKNGKLGDKINDGAYSTMINRISSNTNPDFFFMSYTQKDYRINSLILIPKHFFVPNIIEKRKPLTENAKRAGWVGCNILINKIPEQGKITIICNGNILPKNEIVYSTNRSQSLITKDINLRSWLIDILNCINKISQNEFTLDEIYEFEEELSVKHPDNNNVKPKIRQQLQILRDKGYVEFIGRGRYKKIF